MRPQKCVLLGWNMCQDKILLALVSILSHIHGLPWVCQECAVPSLPSEAPPCWSFIMWYLCLCGPAWLSVLSICHRLWPFFHRRQRYSCCHIVCQLIWGVFAGLEICVLGVPCLEGCFGGVVLCGTMWWSINSESWLVSAGLLSVCLCIVLLAWCSVLWCRNTLLPLGKNNYTWN